MKNSVKLKKGVSNIGDIKIHGRSQDFSTGTVYILMMKDTLSFSVQYVCVSVVICRIKNITLS